MLRIVLAIGIVLVVALLALEVRAWRRDTRRVARRQKALRVASAVLLVTIMAMVLVGDRWVKACCGPLAAMAYWALCFGLTLGLVVLALLDLKEVGLSYGRDRKKILRSIAKPREENTHGE
ncbi:MAG TPA: hypothetical protein VMX94_05165 [Armatimonadota bacterium]|nr:hypothetical protein [Armatimonadota bacterium]